MASKFLALDHTKQQQILNAAMKEFALKGYKAASTNQIVETAGISKGLLFHYFSNKQGLYFYLYDYCVDVILEDFFGQIDFDQKDILLRFREMFLIKLRLMNKYPVIFDFLIAANVEEATEIKDKLNSLNQEIIRDSYLKMFTSVDESLFRSDIDPSKVLDIIIWTIEGISNKVQAQENHIKAEELRNGKTLQELDGYLEILRKTLYN
ncbi:TetR/AcrR family transcriptional regulator [Shimazuella sp. AN120528]|uniref:TetR/AcrR family transcriptional regulator n=1 Tax=Shimazuella soli TaxID=1892854 RepID=UPI001F10CADB|nr:TetR/AcrR family transcriptional regulator [Shimazuella soli]MCH5583865.1 TetR/AcrR family transcriptional regulator [Shimazuella soli]